jgi:hypothetical protein
MSERMKAALPSEEPSDILARRVAALTHKPRPSVLPQRLAFAGAALVLVGGFWMNRPKPATVTTQTTTPQAVQIQLRYEHQLPGRTFRVYDVCQNPNGDILMLYTMGKTPEDAQIPEGIRDWRFLLSYQKRDHVKQETPLSFLENRGAISPKRVSPKGEKFEAICFSGVPTTTKDQPLDLFVGFSRENLHGKALWDAAAMPSGQKQGWPAFYIKLAIKGISREALATHLWVRPTTELVPQQWADFGVNVPRAIQQVARNK